jgi:O-antigen/teichoic acid export membrane protein
MLNIEWKGFNVIRTGLLGDSIFLIGASVASTLGGFIFWLLAARLTTSASVGLASALIASSALLVSFSEMGLSVSLIRYGSSGTSYHTLVNTAIRIAILLGTIVTAAFLIGLPLWAPDLIEVRKNISLALLFFLFTIVNLIMAYQDMAMLVVRSPQFIFWRNVACNIPTSLFLIVLVPIMNGETVVVYAFMLPNVMVVAYTSYISLPKAIPGYQVMGTIDFAVVRNIWRYGFTNHLSNILWSLPAYIMPIFAVSLDSLESAGVFAIAWNITNATFIIPRTVSTAFFAQLSRSKSSRWHSLTAASVIILILGIPGVLILWAISPWILGFFGDTYVNPPLLRTMLLSFVPFSINTLLFTLLRVSRQVRWIVVFSACYALTVIITVLSLGSAGIHGIGTGWLIGNVVAMLPGFIVLALSQRY